MAGATNVVMSPGAQAAPLMMACRANAQAKISVIIDERSAAFYALGLARASGKPTILICTSGSAVGQMYAAVMEASAILAPLIILAADRAPERQDCCAAQAIDQTRVFGQHVRASHHLPPPDASIDTLPSLAARIVEQSLFPNPGPVFVNQPFREPLYATTLRKYSQAPITGPAIGQPILHAKSDDVQSVAERISKRPGLILCGSSEADAALADAIRHLARTLACPIVADPLSGLRFGASPDHTLVTRADSLAQCKAFTENNQPEWILNFCGAPISQSVLSWLKNSTLTDYIVVDASLRWPDPVRRATRMVRADPASFCRDLAGRVSPVPTSWTLRFIAFEQSVEAVLRHDSGDLLWEAPIIGSMLAMIPENGTLFSGNSMSVRDFDTFSGATSKPVHLLANRGVNGIDGSIATLLGIAAHSERVTFAMIGDVAFCHDMGSLQIANDLDVLLVVLNNGGGAIFDYQGAVRTQEYRDFLCPPNVDMSSIAKACGWKHWSVSTQTDFDDTLRMAMATPGCRMIEALIDRKASVARHQTFWNTVRGLTLSTEVSV